jgi:integrase
MQAGDNAGLHGEGVERVGNHDLRHSLVGNALALGATPPQIAQLARHANPKVTLAVYAGLFDDEREQTTAKLVAGGFGS